MVDKIILPAKDALARGGAIDAMEICQRSVPPAGRNRREKNEPGSLNTYGSESDGNDNDRGELGHVIRKLARG